MSDETRKNEGEGSKTADKNYREAATDFAKRTDTLQTGLQAEREIAGKKSEYDAAEKAGKSHSAGDLKNDLAGSDFDKK